MRWDTDLIFGAYEHLLRANTRITDDFELERNARLCGLPRRRKKH